MSRSRYNFRDLENFLEIVCGACVKSAGECWNCCSQYDFTLVPLMYILHIVYQYSFTVFSCHYHMLYCVVYSVLDLMAIPNYP